MGWLRKVGRKVSRKLNKVFGSKLGAVIGAVGLYMLMGPVAKTLTGWASSVFGGAGAAASGTAATATTAATTTGGTAASAAAAESAIAAGAQGINTASTLSEASLLAGENLAKQATATSAANQTVAGQIANATNNMDQANAAISAIDSAAVSGSLNVSPTITDSIIQDAIPAIEQQASVVQANIQQPPPSTFDITGGSSQYHGAGADGYRSTVSTSSTSPTTTIDTSSAATIDTSGITPSTNLEIIEGPGIVPSKVVNPANVVDTSILGSEYQPGLAKEGFFGRGFAKVKELGTAAYEGVTSGAFAGEVAQGVATGLIMSELQGDYEEPFRSAGVASQPISEAAQANYIQSVAPSAMAATGMTRPLSFQELSQQTLYGTGSPNYLSQFYQPLATPRMG